MTTQSIHLFTLLVRDYDEAIAWFTRMLDFDLTHDSPMGGGRRWVSVAPPGSTGTGIRLVAAADEPEARAIGTQAAGRVLAVLHTDDLDRDVAAFTARGVRFLEGPRNEPYGRVAVFEDLCGNRWDLIEPAE